MIDRNVWLRKLHTWYSSIYKVIGNPKELWLEALKALNWHTYLTSKDKEEVKDQQPTDNTKQ